MWEKKYNVTGPSSDNPGLECTGPGYWEGTHSHVMDQGGRGGLPHDPSHNSTPVAYTPTSSLSYHQSTEGDAANAFLAKLPNFSQPEKGNSR